MKKILMLSAYLLLMSSLLSAGEVTIEQAKAIAQNIYQQKLPRVSALTTEAAALARPVTISGESGALLYVFNASDSGGFVIVAADDAVRPLLGYSLHGRYGDRSLPPALSDLLDSYTRQIEIARQSQLEADESIRADWEYYRSGRQALQKAVPVVDPLITSLWDQDRYYNAFCPVDPSGADGHARVGCVATAMAQIMRYHEYPPHGYGSHSFFHYQYGEISANFENASYHWDQMGDWVTDYNDEVAELCFHCGVAVEMGYGPEGSGAYSNDVPYALRTFFNYAPTTQLEYSDYYTTAGWIALLKSELDEYRPVYMSGSGSGGHAFVCDGYDDSDLLHFNWGWGGLYNGYYQITELNPGTHIYSYGQAAVVGIQSAMPPMADFSANTATVITHGAVDFFDQSEHIPADWYWEFEGGTPANSTERNPAGIVYSIPGSYQVSLTASNLMGSDTKTAIDFITVSDTARPVADFGFSDALPAVGQEVLFTDQSLNHPQSWAWQFEPGAVTFLLGTHEFSQHPVVAFDEPVAYTVTLTVTNANGESVVSRPEAIRAGGYPLPFTEDFELGTFKDKWSIENPDGGITWDGYYKVSGNLPSRRAAWINCYDYESVGERDRLISPRINFFPAHNPTLYFKHAYAIYNMTRRDSLIIYISVLNSPHWERIFARGEDGSGNFATDPPTLGEFIPRYSDDWCGVGFGASPISIDLSPWSRNADVRIMFESYNGHGNSLYIDDLVITGEVALCIARPMADGVFREDEMPAAAIANLDTVFYCPNTADSLVFTANSDNACIVPSVYQNQLYLSFVHDFFGAGQVTVTAMNSNRVTVSDTFQVTILPVNDPPQLNLPDSLVMRPDSASMLNVWDCALDRDCPDSLLQFTFAASVPSLALDYHDRSGDVWLISPGDFVEGVLYISVADDSNATTSDSLKIFMNAESDIVRPEPAAPVSYQFYQNYPNPFNAITHFRFGLPLKGHVRLEIFNALGQRLATIVDEVINAGAFEVAFNAGNLPSGLYLARIQSGQFTSVNKFLLMK
ncbi:MAG: C10 family peptidase [Candidatus Zhuqueibacterota bacterium]